ncbi:MAG TPA: glycoside hydrolase family 2 TIM barrel-domain containing protein [Solirubrobacteraceae bacterium]|nr:glycoside hydrolase family 2 TIM barrel-domain containing protein [Solirubrobacteraceae bacterium]
MPAATAGAALPESIPLADGWQFALDPLDRGLAQGWAAGAETGVWQAIQVPHVFDARPLGELFPGSVGWYRLRLDPGATPDGEAWHLHFEQVRRVARIWLNGVEIGGHADPYVPFEVPATGLRPGQPNLLVLRVDGRKDERLREGWWNWAGLTRPVRLVARRAVALDELGVMPRTNCTAGCRAWVLVDAQVTNRSATPLQPTVSVLLTAPSGTTTAKDVGLQRLEPGARVRVRFSLPVNGPAELWSPQTPQRYQVEVRTRIGGNDAQVDRLAIGLRSVQVRNGLLLLNGRAVQLRGASIQEDVLGRGPALTTEDIDRVVGELEALGADVTRAHYALSERMLDRLDAAGILVWSQAPIYHRDALLKTPAQRAEALETVRRTVLAARNHPSVITHSVGNEFSARADRHPGTRRFLGAARQVTRDLDPTLPTSVDILSYPGMDWQRAFAQFDLLGANAYFGWYRGKRLHSTARLGGLEPFLRRLRRQYRHQAIVLSEFGAEAFFPGPARAKGSYAFQSRYVRRVLDTVERRRFVSGAIYFTLQEFAVKPLWDGGVGRADLRRDSIHNKGLISYEGWRKPAWLIARTRFVAQPLYRE